MLVGGKLDGNEWIGDGSKYIFYLSNFVVGFAKNRLFQDALVFCSPFTNTENFMLF